MRKTFITLIKLVITAAVIVFIIRKYTLDRIVDTLLQARFCWVGLAVLVFVLSGVLGVVQWRLLLANKGITLSFRRTFELYFMGMFFNNFIFGTAAADTVRVTYLKLGNHSGKAGFAATFLDRFAGLWAMLGFAIAGSIVLLRQGLLTDKTLNTAMLALAVTFVLFLGLLLFLLSKKLQRLFFTIYNKLPVPKKDFFREVISQMLLEAKDLGLLIKVAILSGFIQLMRISVHILCGAALGLLTGQNFQYFFIFVPFLAIVMLIPLPFGVREAVGGTMYAMAGFQEEAAMVMVFLATIVGILASSMGGVIFLIQRSPSIQK